MASPCQFLLPWELHFPAASHERRDNRFCCVLWFCLSLLCLSDAPRQTGIRIADERDWWWCHPSCEHHHICYSVCQATMLPHIYLFLKRTCCNTRTNLPLLFCFLVNLLQQHVSMLLNMLKHKHTSDYLAVYCQETSTRKSLEAPYVRWMDDGSRLSSCATCGVVMVTWSVDDWIQMVCWVCLQRSWYCFRYDHWFKITALSLIPHGSTSGKSVGSSEHEHPGNYVLIRLRLASLVNLPVYTGLICDYQWFFRNWKRRLQPFQLITLFSVCVFLLGSAPILQVANLTGYICLSSLLT